MVPLKDVPAPWVSWKLGYRGIWLGVRTRAAKVEVGEGEVPQPAFTVLSAGASVSLRGFTFSLLVDNLTDELYWENANRNACPAPGRDIRIGVSRGF